MNKLEEFWQKLTVAQRVALFVLSDTLTNREKVVNGEGVAITSRLIMDEIPKGMDSTVLRPDAGSFLERYLHDNTVNNFDELYQMLMARI